MAEIIIKRKSKRVWPWILGILVVLAIVLWLVFRNMQVENRVSHLQTAKQPEMAARHLRYIPQVTITKLETFLA
ncbi:hypothetical protein [Rhodocytophaga rosea]|uniref:hypothetical protein n=1 Tax=Rhodocytophaga rosea TaxID=2704465 RepID=UPI001390FCD0|nr:hypothetical protein [Rhodocytophaga rosea]